MMTDRKFAAHFIDQIIQIIAMAHIREQASYFFRAMFQSVPW